VVKRGWLVALVGLGVLAIVLRARHLVLAVSPEEAWFFALMRDFGAGLDRVQPAPDTLGHLLERPVFYLVYSPAALLGGFPATRGLAAIVSGLVAPAAALAGHRLGLRAPFALLAGLLVAVEDLGTRFGDRVLPGPLAALLVLTAIALLDRRPRWALVLVAAAPLVDRLFLVAPLVACLLVPPPRGRFVWALAPALALAILAAALGADPAPLWEVPRLGPRVLHPGLFDLMLLPVFVLAAVTSRSLLVLVLGPVAVLFLRALLAGRGAELWQGAALVPGGMLLVAAALDACLSRRGASTVAAALALAFYATLWVDGRRTSLADHADRLTLRWARAHLPADPNRIAFGWALRQKPAHLLVGACEVPIAVHLGRSATRIDWQRRVAGTELTGKADAVVLCDTPPERVPGATACPWQRAGRYTFVRLSECRW
jgi:hypothetical protein